LLCLPLAQCAVFVVFNLTAIWHFKFWPLIASMIFLFTGLCIVVYTEKMAWFGAGFLLIGVGGGISYSASLYYAVALEASIAGARSGWHEFYVGLGGFTGPVIGGLLAHYIGPKSPYAFSAGLVVLVLAVQIIYFRMKTTKLGVGG
jgi:MFS family permease